MFVCVIATWRSPPVIAAGGGALMVKTPSDDKAELM
jgi:hypothetical protein